MFSKLKYYFHKVVTVTNPLPETGNTGWTMLLSPRKLPLHYLHNKSNIITQPIVGPLVTEPYQNTNQFLVSSVGFTTHPKHFVSNSLVASPHSTAYLKLVMSQDSILDFLIIRLLESSLQTYAETN